MQFSQEFSVHDLADNLCLALCGGMIQTYSGLASSLIGVSSAVLVFPQHPVGMVSAFPVYPSEALTPIKVVLFYFVVGGVFFSPVTQKSEISKSKD